MPEMYPELETLRRKFDLSDAETPIEFIRYVRDLIVMVEPKYLKSGMWIGVSQKFFELLVNNKAVITVSTIEAGKLKILVLCELHVMEILADGDTFTYDYPKFVIPESGEAS